MIPIERQKKILDIIYLEHYMTVDSLSKRLDVSGATIRRDLELLEKAGQVVKTYGGVMAPADTLNEAREDYSYDTLSSLNLNEKKAIAQEAVKLIKPGQCIILDAGSTTTEVANMIPNIGITVVTNAINIAAILEQKRNIDVILTGGNLQPETHSLLGPLCVKSLMTISADMVIQGAGGITQEQGIGNANLFSVEVKQTMIDRANQYVVVADHTKLGKRSLVSVCGLEKVSMLITDDQVRSDMVSVFLSQIPRIVIAF